MTRVTLGRPRPLGLPLAALLAAPFTLAAQPPKAPARTLPPVAEQVAAAVLPLPTDLRDGAGVLGYRTAGRLELLRPSRNNMLCLADDPAEQRFHVACYHDSMEPFMKRGRELREQGVTGDRVDTVRFAEVKQGRITMPTQPAMLYSLTEPDGNFDPRTGTGPKLRPLFVTYVPFATAASTGFSTQPAVGKPWLMLPGTPKAHIMFTPTM